MRIALGIGLGALEGEIEGRRSVRMADKREVWSRGVKSLVFFVRHPERSGIDMK